ncbi:MAG: recombinase family protein [Magnetospirillum sp.]|nr:MAG: recombinase family protein [Magnetospirillum sp.]
MTAYGYKRVSTDHQNTALQERALIQSGVKKCNIFFDIQSGADITRQGLRDAIDVLQAGDELRVWRFDRMSRDLIHYLLTAKRIAAKGATLRSLMEPYDLTSPHGWLAFSITGVFAENERLANSNRVKAGLAAARERGVILGRAPRFPEGSESWQRVRDKIIRGVPGHVIAREEKTSEATLYKTFPGGRKALLAAASGV